MKNRRFLKAVVTFSLAMGAFMTAGVLAICWRACEISGTAVAALCTLWSTELCMGAVLRVKGGDNDPPDSI